MSQEAVSELKQRGTANAKVNPPAPSVSGSSSPVKTQSRGPIGSLEHLKPDFVLKVLYLVDPKTLEPQTESDTNLTRLVKALDLSGFQVSIRPHLDSNHLLVFIKLNDDLFAKLAKKSQEVASFYGVVTPEEVSTAERLRLVYSKLTGLKTDGNAEITVAEGSWKFIETCVPVANHDAIQKEAKDVIGTLSKFFNSTFAEHQSKFLLENYGTLPAFYFDLNSLYINWLCILSIIGLVCNSFFGRYSKVFTVLNLLVSLFFYLDWFAKERYDSRNWKLTNVSLLETARPDGKVKPHQVLLRKFLFIPIAIGAGLTLIFYQLSCFGIEILLTELYQGPLKSYLSLVPTILICSIVPIVTAIYTAVVNSYLSFENNATRISHRKSFLVKIFVFNFLASYMALFITSFIYLPFGYKLNSYLPHIDSYAEKVSSYRTYIPRIPLLQSDYEINKLRLNSQYNYFILTNQIVGLLLEFVLPLVLGKIFALPKVKSLTGPAKLLEIKLTDPPQEKEYLDSVRKLVELPEFSVDDEFRQLVIQFGFLALFGPVSSLGPVISLVIELIQSKADYFKLLKLTRPPVPERTENVYPWTAFLKVLVLVGTVSSSAITLMYNGGDIVASVSQSSVKTNWYLILPFIVVGVLFVQTVSFFGEAIISEYFSETSPESLKKEQAIARLFERDEEEPSKSTYYNNVDDLLKFASILPKRIVVEDKKAK
ncbi:hypothetical protein OGAPHI_006907 [Ogataea philodendri]|uniref:Uncharacterized protein n=1 Tax=Ogataea philodendri TaxID=1378263 RepID=A0A9P8T077_9ASCO|nr:uncharacterized protein OGAPHI_006907 [Ogataea philodendri]KAH3660321.1 hypothetical protein OGAPHI_006907 [Ogataea philodendri]